jgi:RimJ/RimL family protein N-acetyltransferase
MQLESHVLESRFVRLEPIGDRHREELRTACAADPETWNALYPYSMLGEQFDATWTRMEGDIDAGRTIAFGVVVDGRCQGMTTYSAIDRANAVLEIGGTYYHPDLRGGAVNPAAKRLLLGNAFESGVRRAQFRVDVINTRSQAAMRKLGATQEGVLRQDRVCWNGRIRDTVIFGVLADEWPPIRDRLDARLAAFAA